MAWAHVYGNAANTSFAEVATQPAVREEKRISGLGRFARWSQRGELDGTAHTVQRRGAIGRRGWPTVVARAGAVSSIATYPDRQVVRETPLEAESIAPAAASRTHVFVSTVTALVTLDAAGLNVAAQFLWKEGGLSTPAIGTDGRVYAVAGDTLFCFAGPPADPRRPGGV